MALALILSVSLASLVAAVLLVRLHALRREVGEYRQVSATAARMELFCPLTGLANHRRALGWLSTALAGEEAPAAIAIALDPERMTPEELSGLAGPIAERLTRLAGDNALAARLGAGEYLLALPGGCGATALIGRAQAVQDAIVPLLREHSGLRVGVALGAASDTAQALVARAIAASGPAAPTSEQSIGVEGPELEHSVRGHAIRARALAAAIVEGRIEPFFQPLVDLASGKVLGFEVLARWRDEDGHVRLPGEFVPLAEQTGLIGEMFFALLRRAAAQVRRWPAEWSFTLNLSPVQFADKWFVERTVQTLLRAGVAAGRLELEISEQALEHDFERARRVIEALRCQGIRVALDKLGSGRLPLGRLAELDFDRFKVDGALLVASDGKDRRAAFGLIAAAAHHLGVPVVVQGLETRHGAEQAQLQGAAIGQGFLFGRPDPQTECFRLEGALAPGYADDAAA